MQKGTLLVKVNGREEGYWFVVLMACWAIVAAATYLGFENEGLTAACTIVCIAAAVRYTLLRTWHIRTVEWSLDEENLTLDGKTIPRKDISKVFFQRNKMSTSSWYLNIRADRNIRLESLSNKSQKAESVATLEALAYALRPDLNPKAR